MGLDAQPWEARGHARYNFLVVNVDCDGWSGFIQSPPDSQHVQDDEDGDGSAMLGSQGCEEVGCACNITMSAKPVFFS